MREERTLCDICKKEGAETITVTVGRRCDAAGSMEDIVYIIDLCFRCTRRQLEDYAREDMAERLNVAYVEAEYGKI